VSPSHHRPWCRHRIIVAGPAIVSWLPSLGHHRVTVTGATVTLWSLVLPLHHHRCCCVAAGATITQPLLPTLQLLLALQLLLLEPDSKYGGC